jgi:calcium/proton exchanger cax
VCAAGLSFAAIRRVCAGEGLDSRRYCHQHALHARSIFFLGVLKHHLQEYNRATARLDAALLFLATIALVSPSAIAKADLVPGAALTQKLSVALAVLLVVGYGLGLLFSLKPTANFSLAQGTPSRANLRGP